MCNKCYEDAGKPKIINKRVIKASNLIIKLYSHPDCVTGGYAHIVTDDWNLEDDDIDVCIYYAEKGELNIDEIGRKLSIRVLKQLKKLSIDERYSALALSEGIIIEGYLKSIYPKAKDWMWI